LWSAGSQPGFFGLAGRLRYMRQPMSLVDLLALIPFLVGLFGSETLLLRLVRLLRLMSLTKLARYSTAIRLVCECILQHAQVKSWGGSRICNLDLHDGAGVGAVTRQG